MPSERANQEFWKSRCFDIIWFENNWNLDFLIIIAIIRVKKGCNPHFTIHIIFIKSLDSNRKLQHFKIIILNDTVIHSHFNGFSAMFDPCRPFLAHFFWLGQFSKVVIVLEIIWTTLIHKKIILIYSIYNSLKTVLQIWEIFSGAA